MIPLSKFPDKIQLVKTVKNGYGDDIIEESINVMGIFIQMTGWSAGSNTNIINSDAKAYIDHNNEWVRQNAYRLEEFKLVCNPFGDVDNKSWYKISTVEAPKRVLLNNQLDHCFVTLDKTVAIKAIIS